jgi:hypothetical protein
MWRMKGQMLDWPVTMSFERDGDDAVATVLDALAAAERLVRLHFGALFIEGIDEGWYLHTEDAEDGEGDVDLQDDTDDEDDELDADETDEAAGPDSGRQSRTVELIDSVAVGAMLREALASTSASPDDWNLSLEGGGVWPRPLHVNIQARPGRTALDIEAWSTEWTETTSRGRADVEQLGRDLMRRGWRRMPLDAWSHTEPSSGAASADARVLADYLPLRFDWIGTRPEGNLESADLVIGAIEALSPILRPRCFEIRTSFPDEADQESGAAPARWMWWLREADGQPSRWSISQIVFHDVPVVGGESMRAFAREALAPCRPRGLFGWARRARPVRWSWIEVSVARVRLPDPGRFAAGGSLRLLAGRQEVAVPLVPSADGIWVTRPDEPDEDAADGGEDEIVESPVTVSAHAEGPTLELRLHWSMWAYPGTAGRADVDRALAALERLGWRRSSSSPHG